VQPDRVLELRVEEDDVLVLDEVVLDEVVLDEVVVVVARSIVPPVPPTPSRMALLPPQASQPATAAMETTGRPRERVITWPMSRCSSVTVPSPCLATQMCAASVPVAMAARVAQMTYCA
jgi:hypothetical protein